MSSTAQVVTPSSSTPHRWPKVLALGIVLLIALGFVIKYVFYYYLHYNEAEFTVGEPHFWRHRGWVLLHITSGMTALLTGPWQFSRRIRQRYLQLHRITGRVYLIAITLGAVAAFRLAAVTVFGRAWSIGLMGLATAWLTTSAMAYYAVRKRQIQIHREWMVRSYVVTFAFVTFRLFDDIPPMSTWLPDADRSNVVIWACWAVPLLFTEVILQLLRMPKTATNAVRSK
jgi:uncharacterized membrane protein